MPFIRYLVEQKASGKRVLFFVPAAPIPIRGVLRTVNCIATILKF
jgi:hypothetical protein